VAQVLTRSYSAIGTWLAGVPITPSDYGWFAAIAGYPPISAVAKVTGVIVN
jgi:hypothetical protein